MAICIAAKSVNEYCLYSEVLLKDVVHLRILDKVFNSYYIALIFFNMSAKFKKYLIILNKYGYIKFGYFHCSKRCQQILFYSEVLLKPVAHLRILGKVLKSYYMALVSYNVSTNIGKILNYIEKI